MPADLMQNAAPTATIQKIITDEYKLSRYLPTLMHAAPLDTLATGKPIYYSLHFPTLLEGAPGTSYNKTIIMDEMDIATNLKTMQQPNGY